MFSSTFKKSLILFFILASSCFGGVEKRGSVVSYQNGTVQTRGGSFQVGILPTDWNLTKFQYDAILFNRPNLQQSISVDSFCKSSADDAALNILTRQIIQGIQNEKITYQKTITLDGKEALHTLVKGVFEGSPINLETVVLRMNKCVFDFVYVTVPENYSDGALDFEKFYQGFHFVKGP